MQVLTVRYLAKTDFGAFAYALAVASTGASVAILGLNRGVNRFVPIDHERRDFASMFGTMIGSVGAVAGLGFAIVAVVIGAQIILGRSVTDDPLAVGLLLIVIGLAPLQALDSLLEGMVATFATPRALCVRRHVIGPGLKLSAVLFVVLIQGSVHLLAWCYLLAGGLGVALYALILHRALRESGLLSRLRRLRPRFGARRLLGFSLPLLSTDLFLTLKGTMAVIILQSFAGSEEVADLRAVVPVAGLCTVVVQSFKPLFVPLAARLYARGDRTGLNDLYWRSTSWIAIASFPIFCVCFFAAKPVTVVLFGERYEEAGVLLAILAVGVYFNAALGLNLYVLEVYARVRAIAAINLAVLALGLGLNLWLVPLYGAVGAAAAITATVIVHNLTVHAGLTLGTGVDLFQRRFLKVYLTIALAFTALVTVQAGWEPQALVMIAASGVLALLVVALNRDVLEIGDAFPQLAQLPLLRHLLGGQAG